MSVLWSRRTLVVVAWLTLSSVPRAAPGLPRPGAPDWGGGARPVRSGIGIGAEIGVGVGGPTDGQAAASAALPPALLGVQAAFLSNDAARMARWFSRRAPVVVSVPPIADGCLAPGPLRAFLDRLVRDRVSTGFELPAHLPPGSGEESASAFVKVKWTHRPAASDTLQVEYLHLALRYAAEDSEWQIVEMRASIR